MIKTCGLTHIHLVVKDIRRSLDFYKSVFGMQEKFWAGSQLVFLNTPGSNDLITLHQSDGDKPTGTSGGILHWKTRLTSIAQLVRLWPRAVL
jgi:catechol 2,3-dioxygenase-like lactoylglutathione lyase family enzyme